MSTCTPAFFVDASDRKDVQNATGDFPARLLIIDSHPASMLDFFSQVFSADAHQVEAVRTAGAAMLSIATSRAIADFAAICTFINRSPSPESPGDCDTKGDRSVLELPSDDFALEPLPSGGWSERSEQIDQGSGIV